MLLGTDYQSFQISEMVLWCSWVAEYRLSVPFHWGFLADFRSLNTDFHSLQGSQMVPWCGGSLKTESKSLQVSMMGPRWLQISEHRLLVLEDLRDGSQVWSGFWVKIHSSHGLHKRFLDDYGSLGTDQLIFLKIWVYVTLCFPKTNEIFKKHYKDNDCKRNEKRHYLTMTLPWT